MNTISLEGCVSYSDVCRRLGLPINGSGMRKAKKVIAELGFDTAVFAHKMWYSSKYQTISKECPVCSKKFDTQQGHPKEKTVCSIACSNTFFRSGENNGQFVGAGYRYLCFCYWKRECAIPGCGWNKVVEVHHVDANHDNNVRENLIPLCPNHHRLTIMNEYKDEINQIINDLIKLKWNL